MKLAAVCAGGLAAVWIGYPLVIRALAGRRRVCRTDAPVTPEVTVVIATREPWAAVADRVRNVLAETQYQPVCEVLVAFDGRGPHGEPPADLTAEGRVRALHGDPEGGKAAALNAALREARGEIVVFADTHQRFTPMTIGALAGAFRDARVGMVSGCLELAEGKPSIVRAYWAYERRLREWEARLHSTIGVTGAVCAIRRSLWRPLPAGLLLDDLYSPMRVVLGGHRVAFVREAVAVDTRSGNARREYSRKVRTLTGVVQLCCWLPDVLLPGRNPVWLQFWFHKLLRLLTPYALLVMLASGLTEGYRLLGKFAPPTMFAVALMIVWGAVAPHAMARRMRGLVGEAVLLQWAVVMAGFNGFRRKWQVWDG